MKRPFRSPYLGTLLLILTVKAIAMSWLILSGPIGLSPDEAQYWAWSRHLDYSYYSKPAAIAWQIAAGTYFFGNTELGVRIGAVILSLLLPISVYLLGHCCRIRSQAAFFAALTMALTPLGILSSILSITDTGMIVFWTLGLAVTARAIAKERPPDYLLIGLCIAVGALYKWPIYLLWCIIIGYLPFNRSFRSRRLFAGIAISLLGLLPALIWNISNGWVSFLHVAASIDGSDLAPKGGGLFGLQGNSLDFWGAQIALVSPLVFFILAVAYIHFLRNRRNTPPAVHFCALSALFLIGFFGTLSLFKKVQGNWCDFVYPGAFIFLGWLASERDIWKRWLTGGLALSTILSFTAIAIPTIQKSSLVASFPIPYRLNPFRHNVGWTAVAPELKKGGYDPEKAFLFAATYQATSILSFYGPDQKQAYFLNIHAIRNNQYSLWPGMADEQLGNDGFFAVIDNAPHLQRKADNAEEYRQLLAPFFDSVEYLGLFPLFFSYGEPMKGMLLFKCNQYNGASPEIIERF